MRLLILGGTVFLGRALTDAALARGHAVTHVNRGLSAGRDVRVETVHADRGISPFLASVDSRRSWDAVVDTSGYLPQVVRLSAQALKGRVGRYAFVSSISAYRSLDAEATREDAPLQPPPDPWPEAMSPELYGALKSACEGVVREAFADDALLVRPGLLVGPHDPTDRFTWWPWRIAQGGPFAAPGRPQRAVQFVDVRDAGEWIVAALECGRAGAFNVTGARGELTMNDVVRECIGVAAGSRPEPRWMPDDFLLGHDVKPWSEMPLWIPESDASHRGLMNVDVGRALREGLSFRPLARAVEDTLAWAKTRPKDHAWKAGLAAEREKRLLEAAT